MIELPPGARAVLDVARSEHAPTPGARERVRARLLAVTAGAVAGSAAAAKASASGATAVGSSIKAALLAKIAVPVVIGAAAVVGFTRSPAESPTPTQSTQAHIKAPAVTPDAKVASSPPPQATTQDSAKLEPSETTNPLKDPGRNTRAKPAPRTTTNTRSLEDELVLIRGASQALREGDGARALALLNDHSRRFGSGALSVEREGLRVLALCASADLVRGQRARREFLKRAPQHPIAKHVRSACTESKLKP